MENRKRSRLIPEVAGMIKTACVLAGATDAEAQEAVEKVRDVLDGKTADRGDVQPDRTLRCVDVAKRLGKSPETIRLYCRKGWLRQVRPPKSQRPVGISEKSVDDFMAGKFHDAKAVSVA